mmetsp:Transcript_22241/g.37173  ORF Transcript_22241/g.37173 Transcript_22241/m.37173 type:complete len:579 (-) Transcript_22241:477-2213(-)|eukprot:CAMPEP_0198216500 /NCGR_PEP_ID=MMETSP1445-20131203/57917_1 /TAXON_ID=36898 /ORGANISM="Pyramimonas sp., Strain CCMP2087" /LENGTH=578 /DNA_ID=CAMNT_0043892773 /DNA_START=28 /DNA_END=1764 /DNA_ORIENTATION=-
MSISTIIREYVKKMLAEAGKGMKVLLVDTDTMAIVSSVYTQSEILAEEVFLVEMLDAPETAPETSQESLLHMKAVCYVRPTADNFSLLKQHLQTPKYGEYLVFFSNIVRDAYLNELAEADENEIVKQVQEYYADYIPLDPSHFTLNVQEPYYCFFPPTLAPQAIRRVKDRVVQGLASVMLSMKRRPLIRYQRSSEHARSISMDMWRLMYEQEASLFDFRRTKWSDTVLLIVDRLDDPVTPLLTQWTYQAMVHELIGLQNHRVDLRQLTGRASKDQGEVVLSHEQDKFYAAHMYDNYGDLGQAVKGLVDDFQKVSKSNTSIGSIEDMQKFVENYPEFRSKSGHVSKHVTVLSELNRIIDHRRLMTASAHEQELACTSNMSTHFAEVMGILEDHQVEADEKMRLVLLFAIRYQAEGMRQLAELVDRLGAQGVPRARLAIVDGILRIAGAAQRTGDLFGTKTFSARASKMVSSLKGVDNVYTQHQPLLMQTLENLSKAKLKEVDYPTVGTASLAKERPIEVVVFVVGGTTYEEARAVALHNQQVAKDGGMKVILGGTCVHNSTSFMDHISEYLKASGQIRR